MKSEWRLEKKLACDFCVTWTTFRDWGARTPPSFTKQPQVARQFFSVRGWRFFWCVFLFVVRKLRDTTARKLYRGRKRKLWRGEKAVSSPRPLPHCFLFRPQFSIRAALTLRLRTPQKTPKKPSARQVSNFLATLAIWSNFLATFDVGGNLVKF